MTDEFERIKAGWADMGYKDVDWLIQEVERLQKKLTVAREALDQIYWLKLTIQKLINDKPDREWIVEEDVNRWASFMIIEQALANLESEDK